MHKNKEEFHGKRKNAIGFEVVRRSTKEYGGTQRNEKTHMEKTKCIQRTAKEYEDIWHNATKHKAIRSNPKGLQEIRINSKICEVLREEYVHAHKTPMENETLLRKLANTMEYDVMPRKMTRATREYKALRIHAIEYEAICQNPHGHG